MDKRKRIAKAPKKPKAASKKPKAPRGRRAPVNRNTNTNKINIRIGGGGADSNRPIGPSFVPNITIAPPAYHQPPLYQYPSGSIGRTDNIATLDTRLDSIVNSITRLQEAGARSRMPIDAPAPTIPSAPLSASSMPVATLVSPPPLTARLFNSNTNPTPMRSTFFKPVNKSDMSGSETEDNMAMPTPAFSNLVYEFIDPKNYAVMDRLKVQNKIDEYNMQFLRPSTLKKWDDSDDGMFIRNSLSVEKPVKNDLLPPSPSSDTKADLIQSEAKPQYQPSQLSDESPAYNDSDFDSPDYDDNPSKYLDKMQTTLPRRRPGKRPFNMSDQEKVGYYTERVRILMAYLQDSQRILDDPIKWTDADLNKAKMRVKNTKQSIRVAKKQLEESQYNINGIAM